MNRKIFAYGLSAIVMLSVLVVVMPVSAQPTAESFGVNDASGDVGTYVIVPVNITNAQDGPIAGVIFDTSYDTGILNVVGAERGDLTSTWDTPSYFNHAWGTRVSIVGTTANAIQNGSTGSVVLLNFSLVGVGSSSMNLSNIQLSDVSGMLIGTATPDDGTFTVTGVAPPEVVINEFEQNPEGSDSGNEWVELYNNDSTNVEDISGWKLINSDGEIVTIPADTVIDAYGYWVTNWTNGSLVNSDENITLYNAIGVGVDKTLTADDGDDDDNCWARFPNGIDTDSDSDWRFQASTMGAFNGPDTTPPYTSGHNPAKGATGVSISTNIVVHVKDAGVGVDQATIVMTVESETVTPVITGSAADYTLTYDPPADFDYEQVVEVTIDANDSAATPNVMPQDAYSFTTESEDATPPYTSGHNPAEGATGVSISTNIVVHVEDDGVGVDQATIVMTVEGETVTPVITGSATDYTLTYDPPADFDYEQVVEVTIDANDSAATPNVMQQDAYSFTTKSRSRVGGGGGGAPRDSDGDGYTDIKEMLAGTDKDDPCDPNPECAACLAIKPAATPTPTAAPTLTVTPTPTIPPVVTTPTPTPTPTPTEDPGFEAVFAIAGLLAVAYLVLRRKSK